MFQVGDLGARAVSARVPPRVPRTAGTAKPIAVQKAAELITDCVYDSVKPNNSTIAVSQATFFQTPISGTQYGTTKTLTHTNLKQSGIIPFDEKFLVRGIGAWVWPLMETLYTTTGTASEFSAFKNLLVGNWQLFVGNKEYQKGPLTLIVSLHPGYAIYVNNWYQVLSSPFHRDRGYWRFKNAFTLGRGTNFRVEVTWDTAFSTTAASNFFLSIGLFGERKRPVL